MFDSGASTMKETASTQNREVVQLICEHPTSHNVLNCSNGLTESTLGAYSIPADASF
jgi:hypothetical protein